MSSDTKYKARGVSAAKEDVYAAIKKLDKGLYPNAFCKILPDLLGGDEAYCNIIHADGSGTKSSLAYLYWKETGDITVWKGIAQDAIVMNTDDLLCAGAVNDYVYCSTLNRNKGLIPSEVLKNLIEGTQEFFDKMKEQGLDIFYGGGETADLGDIVKTIVVDSTITCRMKRAEVIETDIQPGDVIVGLASYGKATYEDEYNSGIGSNGLTAARHDVLSHDYHEKYPETYDNNISAELMYSGKLHVEDKFEDATMNVGKLLLSPTRTYGPVISKVLETYRDKINGIMHCSGGGQTKVMHYAAQGLHIIKDNFLPVPHVFRMIQQQSGSQWKEMYQVFNMGHRMELYTDSATAKAVIDIATSFNIDAQVVGRVEKYDGRKLTLATPHGEFEY